MKTIAGLAILAGLLFVQALLAQSPPVKQWDARFGGGDFDILRSLKLTTDGGYILGGHSGSTISGDKTQFSRGGGDFWILKSSGSGGKQWDYRFGGNGEDILHSLQQTSDGGYILGGYSTSGISGDKSEATRGMMDYWMVKVSSSGMKQWDKRFGGSADDVLYSIQQTADGGYILGGYSASGITGDKSETTRGGNDFWIVKTDSSGIKQWDRRFGGSSDEVLYSLQQTTDGGYILGGYSLSGISGDKSQATQGGVDFWIVKVSSSGAKQWETCYGGSGGDYIQSLQQTTDGGFILGGYSSSGMSGDKSQPSRGGFDYWMVKVTGTGVKQWDARFGASAQDVLYSLQQTHDGGYILGGYSASGAGGDKSQTSQGDFDYWIVKTNSSGIKQWDLRYGGSGQDVLYALHQTADKGYILGGYSSSGITGDKTEPSWGGYDYWIIKIKNFASITAGGPTVFCDGGSVTLTSSAGNNYLWSNGDTTQSTLVSTSGNYSVTVNQVHTSDPVQVLVTYCTVNVNLKAFLEGLYITGTDSMQAVADPVNHPTLCDSVSLSLADSTTQQLIAGGLQPITTKGLASFNFTGLQAGHRYYILLKHRSSLQTWSRHSFLFESPVVIFDFTR